MEIWCGGFPDLENTTTPIDEPVPAWAQNLELSPVLSAHLCLGTSTTLRCPRGSDYVLSIIESNYGVTGSGLCEIPAASHCRQEASLGLACTQSCFIQYNIPQSLSQCGSQNADYLNIDYECIPTRLPNNEVPIDICSSSISDTITIDTGMIVSPQYPTLGAERNCSKKIKTLSNKLWMVFLVDVSIEGANDAGVCDAASLTLHDGIDQIIRCGLHLPELVLISCSDIIEFKFISSHYALGYRGFKVYFQTVNTPPDWACKPPGSSTTPGITTPRPESTTTLVPPSIQIAAYGGTTNGTRQYCKIPFIYQSNSQAGCIRVDPPDSTSGQKDPWCSLTSNFDIDRQWGFCDLGVTDSLMHDVCRSKPQLLLCPSGYLIDILTADYAAKPDGSIDTNACIYDQNDCFESDAPLVQSQCGGLSACVVYHLDRPLSLCQNRPSAYLHVAYTCIPNDIPEINKYDICNSSSVIEDDTSRGFIISPNFPSVHTNIDCTFNLQTSKSYQDIYLYIVDMDLTGPTIPGQNCEKDRLIYTADNTINEMCGKSYPNLLVYTCHKSVTLQLIRTTGAIGLGVKFYFEFRDKPPFQLCPSLPSTTTSITLSPTPSTTTTTGPLPVYYPNPSPRMLKALCYPDLSGLMGAQNFQCPSNYVLVIHRAFYGFGTRCDYTSGDCTTEADIVYRTCAGRQSCSVSFINIVFIQECSNVQANYLFVEYQCLPTLAIVSNSSDLCTGKIDQAGISGILTSLSYPTYTTTQCANTTLTSLESSNLIVYMYLLDLNIGSPKSDTGECSDDYLLLSYQCNNQTYDRRLCGTQPTELLFSTCEPTDQIFASYRLIGLDHQAQRGFALLYHLLPKSDIFTIVTRSTTPATTPSTPGPVSTKTQTETICVTGAAQLKCDIPDYVLVIRKARLAASATNSCIYSPNDCFEDNDNLYNHCPGKTYCFIAPPTLAMNLCNNSTSDYLYVEYQCIPILPKLNLDVCSSNKSFERVEGGAIISSLNYVSENKQCIVDLRSNKLIGSTIHIAFKVYILSLNLPMRSSLREQGAQCSEDDPYIDIDDHELAVIRLCGNSHTRYLLESCSPMIEIRFNNKIISTGEVQYKGFELYFESIQNDECRVTTAPPIPTEPFVIKNETICTTAGGEERVDFSCTPDHGLVFLQSYYFFRAKPDQCDLNYHTCSYRSDQPQGQCAGQQACSYTHVIPFEPESNPCGNKRADSVQFYYQCLPMRPTAEFSTFTFCSVESVSGNSGFIETPSYPNTYQHGQKNCSLSIQLPANNDNTSYSIYLYVLELSIRDTSIMNSSSPIQCFDSIKYTDGVKTHFLCGKIDQPILEYHTNKKELNLTLNIPHASSPSEWSTWQGARLFFYIGNQSLPSPPSLTTTPPPIRTTTTTPDVEQTSPKSKPDSDNEALTIALTIICVLTVLAALIGFGYYRRRQSRYRGKHIPVVTYDADMNTVDDDPKHEPLERRNSSIPSDAFKGTGTFVNPLFGKSSANSKLQTENETSA